MEDSKNHKNFYIKDPLRDELSAVYTLEEAKRRFELISDVQYDFVLALRKGDLYFGQSTIRFYLKDLP
jgi:hypothetical protein